MIPELASTLLKPSHGAAWKGNASDNLIAHSLTSEGHDASEDGTGRGTPIIAAPLSHGSNPNSNAAGRRREDDENIVAFDNGQGDPNASYGGPAFALTGQSHAGIAQAAAVRRLMPVECCRLQGFPDDWLNGNEPPDSSKYAALGDAVTVPVIEWIGRRLTRTVGAGTAQPC